MTTTRTPDKPKPPDKWPDRGPVTVEVTEPLAVYWDGEQRTGTIKDIPLTIAVWWLKQRWITYFMQQ